MYTVYVRMYSVSTEPSVSSVSQSTPLRTHTGHAGWFGAVAGWRRAVEEFFVADHSCAVAVLDLIDGPLVKVAVPMLCGNGLPILDPPAVRVPLTNVESN
jgi:hypothetical protein